MNIIKALNKHLEEYMLLILFVVMTLLILCQIALRYIFNAPLAWSEELARYSFIWLIYVGASYAIVFDKHLKVEILMGFLDDKRKKYLRFISNIFFMIFNIIIVYKGIALIYVMQFVREQDSPVLGIPMGFAYAAVPVCALLMLIRIVQNLHYMIKPKEDVQ